MTPERWQQVKHARARLSTLAETYASLERDFFPLPFDCGRWTSIHKEEVLHGIVGNKQIYTTVIVHIRRHDAETFS